MDMLKCTLEGFFVVSGIVLIVQLIIHGLESENAIFYHAVKGFIICVVGAFFVFTCCEVGLIICDLRRMHP